MATYPTKSAPATEPATLKVPRHIGLIMDGNGRWAKRRGLPRAAGHKAGVENLRRIIRACVELGIPHLTIYAFSTENWSRPIDEVKGLLFLLDQVLDNELAELHREGVQIRHIGRVDGLADSTRRKLESAVAMTQHNTRLVLNVGFNYGGRAEIVNAIKQMLADGVTSDEVSEELIDRYLYTAGQPDPDLIIRTAGEMRVSNFLLWQGAYAEYYAADVYWPDFDKNELLKALEQFNGRERRFGKTSEQLV